MPSRVHCPECEAAFAYSPALIGKTVQCRQCGHQFTVSGPPADATPVTVPAAPAAETATPLNPPPLPPRVVADRPARPARRESSRAEPVTPEIEERRSRRRPESREPAGTTGVLVGLAAAVVLGLFVVVGGVIYLLWPTSSKPTAVAAPGPSPAIETPLADEPPRRLEDIIRDAPPRAGVPDGPPEFPAPGPGPLVPPPRPGPVGPPPGALPMRPAAPPRAAGDGPKFARVVPLPITPAKFVGDRAEVSLPGPVEAVTVAAGGRLLLLHSPFVQKLFVFDVSEARVAKEIGVPDPGALVAGGMNVFFIYQPGRQHLERWACPKLEREAEFKQPFADPARALAMGSASNGPLAAALGGSRKKVNDSCSLGLFDPATLKEINYARAGQQFGFGMGDKLRTPQVRVSADGRVVTGWGPNSLSGAESNIVEGNRVTRNWYLLAPRPLLPSPDGGVLHAPGMQVASDLPGEPDRQHDPAVHFVPATRGDWYVAVRRSEEFGLRARTRVGLLDIYQTGVNRLIRRFDVRDEFDLSRAEHGLDQNVILVPEARVLITVAGAKRTRLVLRRVDLK